MVSVLPEVSTFIASLKKMKIEICNRTFIFADVVILYMYNVQPVR